MTEPFFETLQVVYADGLENFAAISRLNVGAAVIVTGVVTPTPQAKQPFEIQAAEVVVEGESTPDYRCRRSVTALSICGRSVICARGPILFRQYSVSVL